MKTKLFWFYLLCWTYYFGIVWFNALRIRPDGWYAAYIPHWADGAAHLSYMASFAYRDFFPLTHPLFAGHPFNYSFAADFIGGLLVKAGLSLPLSYNALGFVLSLASVTAIWLLLNVITRSPIKTCLASTLFFFSGGLGFRYYLNPATAPPKNTFFFPTLTQIQHTDIVWLNTIVGELIPQRSFLLGLPLGVFVLLIVLNRFINHQPVRKSILVLAGICLGLMPIIHPHTAMIVCATLIVYGSHSIFHFKTHRLHTVIDLSYIAIPAIGLGWIIFSTFITSSTVSTFFRFFPGWMAQTTQTNWALFWLDNWGLFLPLAIIGTMTSSTHHKLMLIPFWFWFILANLFLFQPYDWDNSKLLTWVYLIFTIPVANVLARLFTRGMLAKIIAICACVVMCLSGAVDAMRMLDTHTYSLKLLDNQELALAAYVQKYTSPSAVILTSTTHRNWVPIATGRQILCGYRGWMWTYGINDAWRYGDMKTIYAGSAQADHLIRQYGIDYIVVGPNELEEFVVNNAFFNQHYPVVHQSSTTTIYAVN